MNPPVAEAVAAGEAVDVPNGNEIKKGQSQIKWGCLFVYMADTRIM